MLPWQYTTQLCNILGCLQLYESGQWCCGVWVVNKEVIAKAMISSWYCLYNLSRPIRWPSLLLPFGNLCLHYRYKQRNVLMSMMTMMPFIWLWLCVRLCVPVSRVDAAVFAREPSVHSPWVHTHSQHIDQHCSVHCSAAVAYVSTCSSSYLSARSLTCCIGRSS